MYTQITYIDETLFYSAPLHCQKWRLPRCKNQWYFLFASLTLGFCWKVSWLIVFRVLRDRPWVWQVFTSRMKALMLFLSRTLLFSHCESTEEGTRNVVAECLGKLTLVDPLRLLPQLKVCDNMEYSRLSHVLATWGVDGDVSTAHCKFPSFFCHLSYFHLLFPIFLFAIFLFPVFRFPIFLFPSLIFPSFFITLL